MNKTADNQSKPLLVPTPPAGEDARVQDVLAMFASQIGFVPDALRLYGISPPLLEAFASSVGYFHGASALPQRLTAMIRYLVSAQAECRYCIDLNEGFLMQMGAALDDLRAARRDPGKAPVDEKERPLLMLALKAVSNPAEVDAGDLNAARAQGWSDRDCFDAVVQAANNRALNLVLKTFNVEAQGGFG